MAQYIGGKNAAGTFQTIINQMPPHDVYIEPFLGSGAIMRLKKQAPLYNVGIEIDEQVVIEWEAEGAGGIVLHGDAISFLDQWRDRWTHERVFAYIDPPYLMSERLGKDKLYRHEFSAAEQHQTLLDTLQSMPANWMIAISGYNSKQYSDNLTGWRRLDFDVASHTSAMRTESLWMNYPEPLELHDYQYLGKNFRERARIKKKIKNWKRMLLEMPSQERYAVLDAIS